MDNILVPSFDMNPSATACKGAATVAAAGSCAPKSGSDSGATLGRPRRSPFSRTKGRQTDGHAGFRKRWSIPLHEFGGIAMGKLFHTRSNDKVDTYWLGKWYASCFQTTSRADGVYCMLVTMVKKDAITKSSIPWGFSWEPRWIDHTTKIKMASYLWAL